jgi:hypothetical protein
MHLPPVIRKLLFTSLALLMLGGLAMASGPVFWETSKQDDVLKGDARGVSISENGTVTLAPAYSLVYDTKEAYIWSSTTDAAGNIYLGTGHDGKIFKVTPAGAGQMIYDAPELDVTALVTDTAGNLYAATSPDGKIYKITATGQQSVFYDPPDKYIWSLVYDAGTATLYAGTGDKGIIYKIDATGKAAVFADTTETNIVALAIDKQGNVIAGTDPGGLVLRVSPSGKVFALFDSPTQEIHKLTIADDGSIYALGINQSSGASAKSPSLGTSTTTSLSSEGVVTISASDDTETPVVLQAADASSSLPASSKSSKADGSRSAVFHILADGGSEVLWHSNDTVGFGLRPMADGRVLVGTGSKGRIYQIARDHSYTLLIQSPEDQTSTIFALGDQLYATSSNLGRLYRIGRESVGQGTYTSPVRDTKFAGQWGVVTWRGAGNVELQTRSGNTERPDATWSEWSAPYRVSTGDPITSPRARFIQWRAVLRNAAATAAGNQASGSASARLQTVVVAYLPRNQAPDITSVNVLPQGIAMAEQPLAIDPSISTSGLDPQLFGLASSVPPRRFFQKGARTLTWQATDPNDDTLNYKVMYRTIGDNEWHLLADNLTQTYYTIDGNRLPDGTYLFRVIASDAPGNPAEAALTSEETTDSIEIDNTPPTIKVTGPAVAGQTAEVTFDTSDATSRIVRAEYSVDGGAWLLVYPTDGVADSAHEIYKVRVTFDKPGEHVIAFRCADSSANVGTSKVTATVR